MRDILLPFHIAAGALAIVLGAIALSTRKGGTVHRKSGLLFLCAMLVMGSSGSILALRHGITDGNVVAGLMAAYFVGTAWTTVRPPSPLIRRVDAASLASVIVLALGSIANGVRFIHSTARGASGVPLRTVGMTSLFLAAVMIFAAIGDARVLWSGSLRGGQRLARRLWRMCFALFIAAGSFFSIRSRVARIFPESLNTGTIRSLLILLPFGAMFYWLWRVRRRPWLGSEARR